MRPAAGSEVWLPISSTYNSVGEDPLLDWLDLYGEQSGYTRDDDPALGLYKPDLDFASFIAHQGQRFEAGVYALLRQRFGMFTVGNLPADAADPAMAEHTMEAMRRGEPLISQAVLRDPERRAYGMADLLVRSDILPLLTDVATRGLAEGGKRGIAQGGAGRAAEGRDGGATGFSPWSGLSEQELAAPAPALGEQSRAGGWHYVVLDIKFTTLELLRDGHAAKSHLPAAVQVWLYNEALGAMQGFTPSRAYLLGRNWTAGSGASEQRGTGCLERLAYVDRDRVFGTRGAQVADADAGTALADVAASALDWGRRARSPEAAAWRPEPVPTEPELYPNMNNTEDFPWHQAKKRLASTIGELTLLPSISPSGRAAALARGVRRWDDPGLSAATLGITTPVRSLLLDATLAANRLVLPDGSPADVGSPGEMVLPPAIPDGICPGWKTPAPYEFLVDFETVSNLADDFSALPALGGQPLIFQIGCGHYEDGRWAFRQWTVDRLSEAEELRIIEAWVAHIESLLAAGGMSLRSPKAARECRIIHWSPAEPSFLENSRDSARARQRARLGADRPVGAPEAALWPSLPFFDLLNLVVKAAPVTVCGSFGFGLKSMARALHDAGLIETTWADGPADGLGAMVGAWAADEVAARTGVPMGEQPTMRSIGAYNQVDCRTMGEMLAMLRSR